MMTAIALRILQNKGSNWRLTMAPSLRLNTFTFHGCPLQNNNEK